MMFPLPGMKPGTMVVDLPRNGRQMALGAYQKTGDAGTVYVVFLLNSEAISNEHPPCIPPRRKGLFL